MGSGIRRVGAIFLRDHVSGRTIFAGPKFVVLFSGTKGQNFGYKKSDQRWEKNIPRDDPAILVQFLTKVT